jgi:transposase
LTSQFISYVPLFSPFFSAGQAIRFEVIDRLIAQGTRSQRGNRWCERIWTVIATCSQQGRSVFEYLEAAVTAWFHGEEAPSLLARLS